MIDGGTPIAPSEQAAPAIEPVASPSEQGNVAEATQPVAEVKAPEPEPKVDVEAIRREAAEKVKHDLESQYGKKLSETTRQERERSRQEREQLLQHLGQYVPDDEVAKTRESWSQREQIAAKDARLAQLEAFAAQKQAEEQQAVAVQEAGLRLAKLGLKFEDLPKDVLGASPDGFGERLTDYAVEKAAKLQKEQESAVKKAVEEAIRETEKRLGVTRVAGSEPVGSGKSRLEELRTELRAAHTRGDDTAIREIGQRLEEEVYRRR